MSSVITLTSDLGTADAYVASIKGVILSINPNAVIIDICHSVEPQNVHQAAFVLSTAHRYFPEGTIHVVIVDPGVGSQRRAVILRTSTAFFLAPDNGVLSYILDELCPARVVPSVSIPTTLEQITLKEDIESIAITNPRFWLQPVSTTFHGRDIFAPVAAHLSKGVPLPQFGERLNCMYTIPLSWPYYDTEGSLIGRILHIDNFGNLITNIRNSDVTGVEVMIEIGNQSIYGIHRFYAEKEGVAAIIGSSGYLEVSLKNGDAATFLGVKVGDEVRLQTGKQKK